MAVIMSASAIFQAPPCAPAWSPSTFFLTTMGSSGGRLSAGTAGAAAASPSAGLASSF